MLPTHLIFDFLSEFEVKIDQKLDFDLFLKKLKKSFFFENFEKFCENPLKT
jgi:hypothetical protein